MRCGTQAFIEKLDVDDVIAHLLVAEGFASVEEIAFAELGELTEIEGFDEEIAEELQRRAQDFVLAEQERLTQRVTELQIAEDLLEVQGLTLAMLVRLGEAEVTTLDDLADLSSDELRYIVNPATPVATVDDIAGLEEVAQRLGADSSPISGSDADAIIMAARAHWFDDDDTADADATGEPEQAAE